MIGIIFAVFLSFSWLMAQESKVRVITARARIYAEPSTESYRIETVAKGTILTLFDASQTRHNWLYVYYQSPRWNSKVTGFIQAEMVEEFSESQKDEAKTEQVPERVPEKEAEEKPGVKQREKAEEKPEKKPEKQTAAEVVKKLEPEPKKSELKEEPVRIEKTVGLTAPLSHEAFPFPLPYPTRQSPRVFEVKEPPQPEVVVTAEKTEDAVLPSGAKHSVQQKGAMKTKAWMEEVVIPEMTEVPEKERDVEKAGLPVKTERPPVKEPQIITQKPQKIMRSKLPLERPLFTLSLGYGPSQGGFGGFIQLNTAANISVHWGIGFYPTSIFYPDFDWVQGRMMYSVGVKYYLPWKSDHVRPYLDFQYGGISVEAVRVVTGVWYYTYIYEDIQKTLWGPSLLAGLELRIGSMGLNGAVGVSYVVTKWDYWDQPLFLTADFGVLISF